MSYCKKHLHARWVIKAMIENCEKQMIDLGHINEYYTFFGIAHLRRNLAVIIC